MSQLFFYQPFLKVGLLFFLTFLFSASFGFSIFLIVRRLTCLPLDRKIMKKKKRRGKKIFLKVRQSESLTQFSRGWRRWRGVVHRWLFWLMMMTIACAHTFNPPSFFADNIHSGTRVSSVFGLIPFLALLLVPFQLLGGNVGAELPVVFVGAFLHGRFSTRVWAILRLPTFLHPLNRFIFVTQVLLHRPPSLSNCCRNHRRRLRRKLFFSYITCQVEIWERKKKKKFFLSEWMNGKKVAASINGFSSFIKIKRRRMCVL